ncbi:MAG: alpha-galactosidase, partial [Bacteroidaceae bacterium]|nr:alpha-galactosidase [Bacteroidaceae bacterium]
MVSEDSDLFRAHPDYAIAAPGRARCYGRHQFMLDLTRKEVRDYIVKSVNDVLHAHNIAYVKWDYNRNVTESWSPEIPAARVNQPRPIVINNWEGTYFNFDNDKLKSIADAVAGTGIDTFVLDD